MSQQKFCADGKLKEGLWLNYITYWYVALYPCNIGHVCSLFQTAAVAQV